MHPSTSWGEPRQEPRVVRRQQDAADHEICPSITQREASLQPHDDPYEAAYQRSQELRDRFGGPEKKSRHRMPEWSSGSVSSTPEATQGLPARLHPADSLPAKRHRLAGELHSINEQYRQLITAEALHQEANKKVEIQYGRSTLVLKNEHQRHNLSVADKALLTTFQPAGSELRDRQLEFLLDPIRARFAFQDHNGYWPPITGFNPNEFNIAYSVTRVEAIGGEAPSQQLQQANHIYPVPCARDSDGNFGKNSSSRSWAWRGH